MKFDHYLKRVEESSEFKKFKQENPKAYLCAGFFVLDFDEEKNSNQIDYILPNGKIATFVLDGGVKIKISDIAIKGKTDLKEINQESQLDIERLKGIVEDEMKNRTVTEDVKKIIAILQVYNGKLIWNLNCLLAGLGILQIHIDDKDGNILKFEKHSLLDFMRKG